MFPRKLYDFDPTRVHLSVASAAMVIPRVQGFSPGSPIHVAPAAPSFVRVDGIRGQVARVRHGLLAGTIGFMLEERAPCNGLLQVIAAADRATGLGLCALLLVDEQGLDIAVSPFAWLQNRPVWSKGGHPGTKAWMFDCERLEMINGGGIPSRV